MSSQEARSAAAHASEPNATGRCGQNEQGTAGLSFSEELRNSLNEADLKALDALLMEAAPESGSGQKMRQAAERGDRVANERLTASLGELAGRTERPETQAALGRYAARTMDAHLQLIRDDDASSRTELVQRIIAITEGLTLKNDNLSPEAGIADMLAGYAVKYGQLARQLANRSHGRMPLARNECFETANRLWRYLISLDSLPKNVQLLSAEHGNDQLLLRLCLRPDFSQEAKQRIREMLKKRERSSR